MELITAWSGAASTSCTTPTTPASHLMIKMRSGQRHRQTQTDTDRHRQTQTHTVKDKSEPFLHIFTTLTTLFKLRMIRVNKIHRVEKIKRSRQRVIWMGHKMIFVRTS